MLPILLANEWCYLLTYATTALLSGLRKCVIDDVASHVYMLLVETFGRDLTCY